MAAHHRRFRIGTIDEEGNEQLSLDIVDDIEALRLMSWQYARHIIDGWDVTRCECGWSMTASRAVMGRTSTRKVVALEVEQMDQLASLIGVPTPSHDRFGTVVI